MMGTVDELTWQPEQSHRSEATAQPQTPDLRRWRLLARLTGALADSGEDFQAFADAAAQAISEQIGDGALVTLLDLPGRSDPVISCTHPEPSRLAQATKLFAYGKRAELSDVAYAPVRHPGGTVRGMVVCTRDRDSCSFEEHELNTLSSAADTISIGLDLITTRAQQSAAERRWTTAFEISPVGHALLNLHGRVNELNSAACDILGVTHEQVVNLHWQAFTPPEDLEEDQADLDSIFSGQHDVPKIRRLHRADGSYRWVQRSISLLRDHTGKPEVISLQFIDITEQHVAELRAATFVALANSSPDFVSFASLDGQVQYVNPAGRVLAGLSPDFDVTQTKIEDYQSPDMLHPVRAPAAGPTLREVVQGDAELRNLSDGSLIPVSTQDFVLLDTRTDEPIGLGTIQRDIRETLKAQQAISDLAEQRRNLLVELVSAEQAERERIANEVHDDSIQLLAAGQLRLQLLSGHLARGDVQAARKATDDIAELISNAQRHLRQVLLDLEPPHTPGRMLDEALRQTGDAFFADTHTRVMVTGALTDLPPDIASVFYRAGREAVSNARQHAQARTVAITLSEDRSCWRMNVTDDGVGVPDVIERQPGHLGIRGMTSRIEALGGRCVIEREQAGGTSVLLEVPRSKGTVSQPGTSAGLTED